jgi:hypothetical protein
VFEASLTGKGGNGFDTLPKMGWRRFGWLWHQSKLFPIRSAYSRQLRVASVSRERNWGTPVPLHLSQKDTKMPVCGQEDGGGVVAKCLVVMTRTR